MNTIQIAWKPLAVGAAIGSIVTALGIKLFGGAEPRDPRIRHMQVAAKMSTEEQEDYILHRLKEYPDFPKKGILFRDFFEIFRTSFGLHVLLGRIERHLLDKYGEGGIDVIVGLDSRGFVFGAALAADLDAAFVPVRKANKLPGRTKRVTYAKEYGSDVFEIQEDALKSGQRVVVVDDLVATGGSLLAACQLVESCDAEVLECVVVIELEELGGRANLPEGVDLFAVAQY